jgi:hypothetical protein
MWFDDSAAENLDETDSRKIYAAAIPASYVSGGMSVVSGRFTALYRQFSDIPPFFVILQHPRTEMTGFCARESHAGFFLQAV